MAAQQTGGRVAIIDGPDLRTLVAGLNNIGVKPDGIIAILQGIKSAERPAGGACAANDHDHQP
ncbi:flagellar basal body P-ring protein FlgI [Rhizobium beringeri]